MSQTPTREFLCKAFRIDRETGRGTFDDRCEGRSVGLAGSEKSDH